MSTRGCSRTDEVSVIFVNIKEFETIIWGELNFVRW